MIWKFGAHMRMLEDMSELINFRGKAYEGTQS